ncbi:long-chain-fatty-acid--CoA ligase [Sulfodiicoccus acidiphilus]|nr:long-chain-fatty-acid--CoA ligase [Sulfodiicoccus acidiphilus]
MAYDYQLNIKSLLDSAVSRNPNTEVVYKDERYTLSQFRERVARLAQGLHDVGVRQGDVVAVIDWDTMRYMELYFAVPMMGATLHTVNVRYPPEVVLYTMKHADDSYVIVRDEFLPLIEKFKDAFSFVKGWIVYSDDGKARTSLEAHQYSDLLSGPKYDFPELPEETRATMFYTSGTTGMPKGVWFTHRQLVLHAQSVALAGRSDPLALTQRDVYMILVPMFHVHAWGMPYVAVTVGSKYVLPGKYEVPRILELIKREGVTYSAMVPTILYMILNHPGVKEYAQYLKGMRITIGGMALPRGLAAKAKEMGITTVGGYGLSETCPVLTIGVYNAELKDADEETKFRCSISAGTPVPLVELRVVDENMNDVPHDGKTVGEVVVRAPWLTKEYYKDPERTERLWRGGWLHTGDLATMDQYGYVTIVDRESDSIKSGGEFIPTLLLESAISECPGVGEVAVVGVPDQKWGQRPVAFVVKSGEVNERVIRDHLARLVEQGRIQKWWMPDRFVFVDSMPKTSTHKVDKKELRKMIQ